MIEYLRKQERLSLEEENRIDTRIRIAILAVVAAVVVVIIVALVRKMIFGKWYYALILSLVAAVWIVKYILSAFLKHSLAGRTDEQVSAYLKAAGLELVAYAGLGWFLVALQGSAIIGAAIYVFGLTGARRQMDIYYQEPETDTAGSGEVNDRESEKPVESDPSGALPSAANRQQREKESEDGSV